MSKKEEVKLLQTMLKEREKLIASLEEERREQDEIIAKTQEDMDMMIAKQKEEKYLHEERCENLVQDRVKVEKEMHLLQREMKESSTLHEYANLLRRAGGSVESTYVLRLQSQLCKSMHSMGMLENQMTIVKKNCNGMVKSLKDEIAKVIDEKCKMEVELMSQLAVIDSEKQDSEEEWKRKLEEKRKEIKELEEKVGPLEDESEEDDDSACSEQSESDEEMEEHLKSLKEQIAFMKKDKASLENGLRRILDAKTNILDRLKEEHAQKVALKKRLESGSREKENGETSDLTGMTENSDDSST